MTTAVARPARGRSRIASDAGGWRYVGGAGLVLLVLLYGFPLFFMLSTSFKSTAEIASFTWLPSALRWEAYTEFLTTEFVPALRNSATISGLTTMISLGLAVPAAYGLAGSRSRLVTPVLLLVLLVQMIPTSAMFIPLFQLLSRLGLVDRHLGVALAISTLMVPFAVLVLRPGFAALPPELEEAAAVDGAGRLRYLLRIALPLMRNSIATTAAVVFVASWAELLYPLTFLLDSQRYPLSVFIAQSIGRFDNTSNILMAVAVLASIPVLLVVLLAQGQLRKGLTVGAVK